MPSSAANGNLSVTPLIRPATRADWQEIVRLSVDAFGASAWPWKRWRELLNSPPPQTDDQPVQALALVAPAATPAALTGPGLAGYVALQMIHGEVEIQALTVAQPVRRQGWGTQLIEAACARARTAHCHTALLEVRLGNLAAQAFYGQQGFVVCGRRPRYYHSPPEDALLMRKSLLAPPTDATGADAT